MDSDFERFRKLSPGPFLLKAIVSVIVVDLLLLAFILLRRTYRKRYFAKRDARMLELRQRWDALICGEIPYTEWRRKRFDRQLIEAMVLDAYELANPQESARLLQFMRASGLIEKRIMEARHHHGWRRQRALVALGRTRALEGIQALSEGLRDGDSETRLAALRGLGRIACPEAAAEILDWVDGAGLVVPALPLQSALVQTCSESPQVLLPHLDHPDKSVREVLARVLGEVATPALAPELLRFADDDLPELRAAAARGLAFVNPTMAISVLTELATDSVWFVRLRAIVSLAKLCHVDSLPALLKGLTDANRLVRLRAAEGLITFRAKLVSIIEQVLALQDQYGFHAFVTALENAGLRAELVKDLEQYGCPGRDCKETLVAALRTGKVSPEVRAPKQNLQAKAASQS